jgi:mannose-1-phosphate guanylyltransferase
MNVMILAAGEGTRFRPYTLVKPKPAIPFLNIPLAYYSMAFLQEIQIERLIVNTYHLPEKIVKLFEGLDFPRRKIVFSHEKGTIQGNGGGLKFAQKHFDMTKEIVVLNGDEVILPKEAGWMKKALELHRRQKALATLFVIDHPEVGTKFGGVWANDRNEVLSVGKEQVYAHTKPHHFIGVYIVSPKVFEYMPHGPSHIFNDVLVPATSAGEKVLVHKIQAEWFETGNLKDYLHATEACLNLLNTDSFEGIYLNKILKKFSPLSTLKKSPTSIMLAHAGAKLHPGFKVDGFAVIGDGAIITGPSQIKNCVIDSGAEVKSTAENELFLKN